MVASRHSGIFSIIPRRNPPSSADLWRVQLNHAELPQRYGRTSRALLASGGMLTSHCSREGDDSVRNDCPLDRSLDLEKVSPRWVHQGVHLYVVTDDVAAGADPISRAASRLLVLPMKGVGHPYQTGGITWSSSPNAHTISRMFDVEVGWGSGFGVLKFGMNISSIGQC